MRALCLSAGIMLLNALMCVYSQETILVESDDGEYDTIVMGDWGGIGFIPWVSPFQVSTAGSMASVAKRYGSESVFALGDNFYWNGVTDEFDGRFQHTFENVFYQDSLQSIPWYILAGNHDHYGNVTGQIEYSKHSTRWNFPSLWYTIEHKFPKFSVTFLMIDTVTLCGNTLYDAEGSQPKRPRNKETAQTQYEFIKSVLSTSKSEYLVVMGHFPVYSISEHGPTQCLVDQLQPLLEQYNVSAYFCGHDHNLQHLSYNGVNYFVVGAVDVVDPSTKHSADVPDGSLVYHWANILGLGGYSSIKFNELAMVVKFHQAVDNGLKILHTSGPIPPRKL